MSDPGQDNLLVVLHKWARKQDENFTTDAFAHLLRYLLSHEPQAGVDLLLFLTDKRMNVPVSRAGEVNISTQVKTDSGRPDMEISTDNHLVYVEVKVESGVNEEQLYNYKEELRGKRNTYEQTTLVFLTRYHASVSEEASTPDVSQRWYKITSVIENALRQKTITQTSASFLAQQFVEFMDYQGMAMGQINVDMKGGVRSYRNLMRMIGEALCGRGDRTLTPASEWVGYFVLDQKGWVGIEWDHPSKLIFHTYDWTFDKEALVGEYPGKIQAKSDYECGYRWYYRIDVEELEQDFFNKSVEQQMEAIERFVEESFSVMDMLAGTE